MAQKRPQNPSDQMGGLSKDADDPLGVPRHEASGERQSSGYGRKLPERCNAEEVFIPLHRVDPEFLKPLKFFRRCKRNRLISMRCNRLRRDNQVANALHNLLRRAPGSIL